MNSETYIVRQDQTRYHSGDEAGQKKCGAESSDPKSPLSTPSPRFCGRWTEYAVSADFGQDYEGKFPKVTVDKRQG
jgi:hypothetical protein